MTEESIVFMFIIGCSTILSYFAYKIGRGNKKMNFWKYNIGDEIVEKYGFLGVVNRCRIVERRTILPTDCTTPQLFNKSFRRYTVWGDKEGTLTVMDESEIDKLVKLPNITIERNVADAIKVTVKENDANVLKHDNSSGAKSDSVNHPKYYQGKIEVIDFIEDKGLGFNLGNCVKYISRAGKKNQDKRIEDLKKARWYLDREINKEK